MATSLDAYRGNSLWKRTEWLGAVLERRCGCESPYGFEPRLFRFTSQQLGDIINEYGRGAGYAQILYTDLLEGSIPSLSTPCWWNGIHRGFKTPRLAHKGSSPLRGTGLKESCSKDGPRPVAESTETGVGTPELLGSVANVTFSGPSKGFDRSGYGWIRCKSVSREASRSGNFV